MYFYLFVAGFFGGVARGVVGFLKHQFAYKNVPFNLSYFFLVAFLSGTVGMVTAAAIKELGLTYEGFFSPALGFIVGYAGGDFIENIYKIIIKKSSLYPKKETKGTN